MSEHKTFALGIDLGGTKTLAAVIDVNTGKVVASARKRTRPERGQDFVSQRTIELSSTALDAAKLTESDIIAIGVGAAGQVDRQAGIVTHAPNLGVHDFALRSILGTRFKVP